MEEKDIDIYELMYELSEEENGLLRDEIDTLKGYIAYLQDQTRDLVKKYNAEFDINKRLN